MRIEWPDDAVSDLKAISEYVEQDRILDITNRLMRAIYDAIQSLQGMPAGDAMASGEHAGVDRSTTALLCVLRGTAIYVVLKDLVMILHLPISPHRRVRVTTGTRAGAM
jgi:plasmid stabilization system protein ParE